MRHKYIVLLLIICSVSLFSCSKSSSSSRTSPISTGTSSGTVDEAQFSNEVLTLVNQERANASLSPLQWDDQVAVVADAHSDCQRDHGDIYHDCPYGHGSLTDRLNAGGVSYGAAGENVARGQSTPQAVMTAWMESPGHRANILNGTYTHIGIGLAMPGFFWTQNFISK